MKMRITDNEQKIDIKSKKAERGDLFKYLSTTTMKDGKSETEIQRIALMLAVLTVQNTTWKDKNNLRRSKRKKKGNFLEILCSREHEQCETGETQTGATE